MDQARQKVVETINGHNNVLVTVSTDPSVDELSAAIGLTVLLDNLEKRSATIFSGAVPPAITFLEPEKTFENSPDSLRDFIIALDKSKADHLRYKVEGDSVKIFITPYRTTLSQGDLQFTQGDYNVELVIALGVKDQGHLDKALEAHGKILHDATVVTVTSGKDGGSNLGSLNWHDHTASSLSEMVASLADGLKGDKKTLLDQQISTALLTGIVSATDRFSNDKTSARTMTLAAQLMAAGANQQLIAAKLEEAHDIPTSAQSMNTSAPSVAMNPVENSNELVIDRTSAEELQGNAAPLAEGQQLQGPPPAVELSPELAQQPAEQAPALDPGPPQPGPSEAQPELPMPPAPVEQPQELMDQLELEKQLAGINGQPGGQTAAAPVNAELAQQAAASPPPQADQAVPASDMTMPGFEPSAIPAPAQPLANELPPQPSMDMAPPLPAPSAEPPQIINDHGPVATTEGAPPPINGIQGNPNDGEAETIDPFTNPQPPTGTPPEMKPPLQVPPPAQPAMAGAGTPEGAALLGGSPDALQAAPQPAPAGVPQLPPLPPLPADANFPSPPPPPPPPPMPAAPMAAPGAPMPAGAISGDVFGDGGNAPAPAPPAAPEPGQFRIPGQPAA